MIRKLIKFCCLVIFIGGTLLWGWSGWLYYQQPDRPRSPYIGLSIPPYLLLNLVMDHTGYLHLQYFRKPCELRTGLLIGASPANQNHTWDWADFSPGDRSNALADRCCIPIYNWAIVGFIVYTAYGAERMIVLGRRRRRGLCLNCGYNLQGRTGDRCSECGHEIQLPRNSDEQQRSISQGQ
ncbi:MAG: hypothetical protein HJJLKODD_01623 [Phycisphaerae bacterium]|nr:hypothetical protein [Phycisphaerae bacterium]